MIADVSPLFGSEKLNYLVRQFDVWEQRLREQTKFETSAVAPRASSFPNLPHVSPRPPTSLQWAADGFRAVYHPGVSQRGNGINKKIFESEEHRAIWETRNENARDHTASGRWGAGMTQRITQTEDWRGAGSK